LHNDTHDTHLDVSTRVTATTHLWSLWPRDLQDLWLLRSRNLSLWPRCTYGHFGHV